MARCPLLHYALQKVTKPLLQEVYCESLYGDSFDKVPRGTCADLIFVVHEWATANPRNHARVCETLLGKLPKRYINHYLLLLMGRGHAGKNKKDAIEKFIALDRPAN